MAIWLKDGKLITDANGKPIVCAECPCGSVECSDAVDAEIQAYLAEIDPSTQQHVWTLYGTYEANYTCAEWAYDTELLEWTLVHPADGYLLIALRKGQIVTDTTDCIAEKLVYAKTIYKAATGEYKTIGCQCRISDHECKHYKVPLDDYLIAGELHVKPYDQSDSGASYAPSDACEVDPCEVLKLKLTTAQYWHGGQLMGEGYFDKWKYPNHSWGVGDYEYTPFQMAILWELDSSDSESTSESTSESESESTPSARILTYIDCPCAGIYTEVMADDVTCLEYDGICTAQDPCLAMMLLHNEAMVKGWTWHGEGVLVHRAHAKYSGADIIKDWYAWLEVHYWFGTYDEDSAIRIFKACAETPEKFIFIDCDCNRIDRLIDGNDGAERGFDVCYKRMDGTIPVSETNPADYRIYLEMDGICNCSQNFSFSTIDPKNGLHPFRELLLTYPDVFGVLETCYGNHAKFDWSSNPKTSTRYDYEQQQEVTYVEQSYGCNVFGNPDGSDLKIDYRALCVITRGIWQDGSEKCMVRAIYPRGSLAMLNHQYLDHYVIPATGQTWGGNYSYYDNATIRGDYVIPFTRDEDIGSVTLYDGVAQGEIDGWTFAGETYAWRHSSGGSGEYGAKINGCQPTEDCDQDCTSESEARSMAGCNATAPTPCIGVDYSSASNWDKSALLSPDFTVAMRQDCSTRRVQPDPENPYWYYYCYVQKWFTVGANVGECAWYLLNVNYIHTNKGLIVKGLDGFRESYTLIGVKHYPQYACGYKEGDEHWDDKVEDCPADEDMYSCLGWTDWGDESDSESQSESSESVSV